MIAAGDTLAEDYDEPTLKHYLQSGMVEEMPAPKPKTKKPAKPKETK